MIGKLQRWCAQYAKKLLMLPDEIAETKMLAAKLLIQQTAARGLLQNIQEAEFRVSSQFGEDGILQYLIRQTQLPPNRRIFVEFGVETYQEANTRFLLMNDNWRGLIIDGSEKNIAHVKSSNLFWKYNLTAVAAFIDKDNINRLIEEAGFSGEIGILSVDIDGNDYFVWDAITVVKPVIVVAEYNSVFGGHRAVTVPYDPAFIRGKAHYSNLYWGCSIKALELLAERKGYKLVGSNSAGNNVFFVHKDHLHGLQPVCAEDAYVESQFRESRDIQGNLTYVSGNARIAAIKHLPVLDVEKNDTITLAQAYHLG